MNRRSLRRLAIGLVALLAFAQASVALAACPMERAGMAQMLAGGSGCSTDARKYSPQDPNRCVAHCTSDLQLSGLAATIARAPADAPVLLLPRAGLRVPGGAGLEAPPPGAVPSRILLHSFLI